MEIMSERISSSRRQAAEGSGSSPERNQQTRFSPLLLILIFVLCLLPFSGKAFHIDDPVFIWTAKHILSNPFDFYGFQVNWYGFEMPMYMVQKNPPLASYYIALILLLFGSGELILHIAFLLPAIAVVLGTYYLAREFCSHPFVASLAGLLTPAFLVSSNTLMGDVMMLSFWVWAVLLWIQGMKKKSALALSLSAILICLSALTKYYGISLVPLLLSYSLAKERTLVRWGLALLFPLLIIFLYDLGTKALYGHGLFRETFSYARNARIIYDTRSIPQGFIGLTFAGGGFVTLFFLSAIFWSRRAVIFGFMVALLIAGLLVAMPAIGDFSLKGDNGVHWLPIIQIGMFATTGLAIISLVIFDLFHYQDSKSLLLFFWILGTFLFAAFLNWAVNIRVMLPMAPAVGILVMRRYALKKGAIASRGIYILFALLAAAVFSLFVVWADYSEANTAKNAAVRIASKYVNTGRNVWFQGHWGFQYYMQALSAKPLNFHKLDLKRGDIIVTPPEGTNANIIPPPEGIFEPVEKIQIGSLSWLSVMNKSTGAGFYSSLFGPLPFTFGYVPEEIYDVSMVNRPVQLVGKGKN
jgi:4-amino-4-deoxy-L-arabinose transferase-like glycosyltransferase